MTNLNDYKKYKEALVLLKDIENILKVINLTENCLSYYTHYIPAFKVLTTVKIQKEILKEYQTTLNIIKKNKGRKITT